MGVRRKLIRELVEDLLVKHRIRSAPVHVEKIVDALDVKIKLDAVDDELSGFLVRNTQTHSAIIGANKSHHKNRQRFTIAHELGHFLLHSGEPVHIDERSAAFTVHLRNAESSKGESDEEKEANFFAAELLMPAKFLERDLKGKKLDLLDDDVLTELAIDYQVSVQALTFRLAYLRYIEI